MTPKFKKILKPIVLAMQQLGFDPFKMISLKNYFRYRKDKREWINKGGKITHSQMVLSDYEDVAGNARGHYFHQPH